MSGIKISHSANEKYQNSPRSWYLHYSLRLRQEKLGSPLCFGGAVDEALNAMLEEKVIGATDVPDPYAMFERKWTHNEYNGEVLDLRTSEKVKWSKADYDESILLEKDHALIEAKNDPSWVSMRRKGIMMLDSYAKFVMPHIKEVKSIQSFIDIDGEGEDMVIGYADFIAVFELDKDAVALIEDKELRATYEALEQYNGKTILFDNKTSSNKYKDDSVEQSPQLGTYIESPIAEEHGVEHAGYIVMPKKIRKKKSPRVPIQIIIGDVSQDIIDGVFEEYADTIEGIKLGNFPCTGGCKANFFGCTYDGYCKSGGKDMTGLVKVKKGSR